jgi:hypothetical protein
MDFTNALFVRRDYFNYVKFIAQAGVIGDFYFSHKFGAWRNGKLHYRGKAC